MGGRISDRYKGSIAFWAWVISITAHAAILSGFWFTGSPNRSEPYTRETFLPSARITHIRRLTQSAPVIPKPKIDGSLPAEKKDMQSAAVRLEPKAESPLPVSSGPPPVKPAEKKDVQSAAVKLEPKAESPLPVLSSPPLEPAGEAVSVSKTSADSLSQNGSTAGQGGIQGRFQDQTAAPASAALGGEMSFDDGRDTLTQTDAAVFDGSLRRICYVVDCSGSMKGVLGRVCNKLKESVASLQPYQDFYIILFGGGRLFEFGNGQMVRATAEVKAAAFAFIDRAQSEGPTNAAEALEKAVCIRNANGKSVTLIYLLTDGFELTAKDASRFAVRIENLRKRFAPAVRIDTIGFWPQSSDSRMLEAIAQGSGGEFVLVAN